MHQRVFGLNLVPKYLVRLIADWSDENVNPVMTSYRMSLELNFKLDCLTVGQFVYHFCFINKL